MNVTETRLASRFLWAFVALFIILGLGYDTLTPIFENSDETLHYPYVKHLADGKGLPLAIPGQLWHQEGTQHPLYYAIVAASTFWLDSDNLLDHLQRNPHWLFSEVRALINDNQNVVLHGPTDAFPYHRAALAIHIGRWWSLVFGAFTVVCACFIARRLFPHNLSLAVTATALTALNPQFIRVSATVSNDSLSTALTTLTILLALKFTEPRKSAIQPLNDSKPSSLQAFTPNSLGLHPSSLRLRSGQALILHPSSFPLLLGLLTGLALLTKLSSLTTLFLVAFIIFWRLYFLSEIHQTPLKTVIRWLVIIVAITAALTGWWFWRNYQLYGEWLAAETHLNLAGRADLSLTEAWGLRAEAERAYWATFGWGQIRPPEWVFRLLFLFTRIGFIGLCLALLARLIQGVKSRPLPFNLKNISFARIIILLLWATMNLMLYLRWVMSVGSVSHTRLVFPAIAAISLLLALGWHALLPRRLEGWFSGLVTTLLLALNIYSLGWLIYPAFRPVESLPRQAEASTSPAPYSLLPTPYFLLPTPYSPLPTSEINLTFLNRLKLAKGQVYSQNNISTTKPQASQGDTVMISALWQALAPMDKNYSIAAVLHAPDGSVLARRETYPGLGLRPTCYLTPGDTFVDVYPFKLEVDVPEPIVAQATVNLFDFVSKTRTGFPALDASGNEVTPIVGQIKLVPQTWPDYHPQHSVQVNFDHAISLIGYNLAPDTTTLVLYWASLAPVSEDYVVFIHLLDPAGNIIAQADAPPTNNAYPTSWWSPGEVIADSHTLPTSPDPGALRLGLYRLDSGQRLTIAESTLPTQDNSVEIVRQ